MSDQKILDPWEEKERSLQDYHDHHSTDLNQLKKVLFTTIDIIEKSHIPYALIGGIAAKNLGRPRITHDIDIFVAPEDANPILNILKQQNFIIQKRDPYWLYKAWKENILVDIIFKSSGDIYFDDEMRAHVRRTEFSGKFINSISPEDFIVIKAAAHQEHNPHHWHDALAVLKQGNLDWDYLLQRAKHAPRRILSLLIYGQSNDIGVPNEVIKKLFYTLFEKQTCGQREIIHPYREDEQNSSSFSYDVKNHHESLSQEEGSKESPIYTKGRIMEALTSDERIVEHDIKIYVHDQDIIVKGEVYNLEQKNAVNEVIHLTAPHHRINNYIEVRSFHEPPTCESIKSFKEIK